MTYAIFILVSLALPIGFLALTWYEGKRGMRVLSVQRARLDRRVEDIEFILTHVNLGAFLANEARRLTTRIGHNVAHFSLLVVRATERLLTRLVRHLRVRREADAGPRESVREFVKTLSDFKDHLEEARPPKGEELGESPS